MPMNQSAPQQDHIFIAVGRPAYFWPLLSLGYALAKARSARLTILSIHQSAEPPDWLRIPSVCADLPIEIETVRSQSRAGAILSYIKTHHPTVLLVGWRTEGRSGAGYRVGGTLETLLRQAPCEVAAVRVGEDWPEQSMAQWPGLRILVPMSGGPNAPLAMDMALGLSARASVTALHLAPAHTDTADFLEHQKQLTALTRPWAADPRLKTKTLRAESVAQGLVTEAADHDITMLGASAESVFEQVIFGALPRRIGLENRRTTIIVRRRREGPGSAITRFWWRATHLLPNLPTEERANIYKQIRRGARPKIDFFMMIGLSAAIAAFGLLLDSPAVIIGAMLVAPLMAAIIGMGLGVIQADVSLLKLAAAATLRGALLATGVGAVVGFIMPDPVVTAEILSRAAPTLLDLGVALVSGLAGAYALCHKDVSSSLPGVAIAAALVPPLATVGVGLAWAEWAIAGGALLLFLTNLVAIVAAGALIFFWLGFRPKLRRQGRTRLFVRGIVSSAWLLGVLIAILSDLTAASLTESRMQQQIDRVLRQEVAHMAGNFTLNDWRRLPTDDRTLRLEVEVRSPLVPSHQSVSALQDRVAQALALDSPLALTLVSIRTTELNPVVPPTPTPTVTPGPSATPTATPTPTPTATATATPTVAPPTVSPTRVSTSTPSPTPAPTSSATTTLLPTLTPAPAATPTPVSAVVAYTGGRGVVLRWSPGGLRAGAVPENTRVQILYRRAVIGGVAWLEIKDPFGRTGWVAEGYLEIIP